MWRYLLLAPFCLLSTALPLAVPVMANLEYEYAWAAALLAVILLPIAGLLLPKVYLPLQDGRFQLKTLPELVWIFVASPLLALAPGAFLFWSGACLCSRNGFIFWMLLIWYPAWILAHAAYHGVLRARMKQVSRRRIFAAGVLLLLTLAAFTAATLWFSPQKRILSPVFGFLHGPIYDDWIAFDSGLALGRASHFFLAMMLLVLAWWQRRTPQIVLLATLAFIWLGTGILASNFSSTKNGKSALDQVLDGRLEGPGFTLHYQPAEQERNSKAPVPILRLFRDASFHMAEISKIFGEKNPPHVEIYIYPSEDKKKLWFGGASTDVTDVVTPSVHISQGPWPHPTLRHELVHALASGFGYHGLGFHPNLAFTEGLAVALAPDLRSLTLDDGAASLLKDQRLPPIKTLFSPLFWKVSSSRAYTVAGSFLKYLIAKGGMESVKSLYSGQSWEKALGKKEDEVIAAWTEKVTGSYDHEQNKLFAEALFRRPGILNDRCPHSKADLDRDRDDAYVRMRQPIGWDPALHYLPWLQDLDPEDQSIRLRSWRREIRKVAQDRFAAPGRLTTWREALQRARSWPPTNIEDVEMAVTESDLARSLGDTEGSIKILQDLSEEGKKRFFGDRLTREIAVRLRIETHPSVGPQAFEWRRYLAGFRKSLPDSNLFQGPWVLTYLKVYNNHEMVGDTLKRLLVEYAPDPEMDLRFHLEWYRTLAERLMRAGDFKAAATAYKQATEVAPPASKELYEEHLRRANFYAEKGPLHNAAPKQASAMP